MLLDFVFHNVLEAPTEIGEKLLFKGSDDGISYNGECSFINPEKMYSNFIVYFNSTFPVVDSIELEHVKILEQPKYISNSLQFRFLAEESSKVTNVRGHEKHPNLKMFIHA